MTRKEHLEFCKVCTNRKMNPKVGLVCSLTSEIADFKGSCSNFNRDEVAEQDVFARKMAATGDYEAGDPMDYKKNKTQGAITFALGCIVTILSHAYINLVGVAVITYGAILYGAFQYYRGVEQEKIAVEQEKKKDTSNKTHLDS